MGKIDDCELVILIFFGLIFICCLAVFCWVWKEAMSTPSLRFRNPPPPPPPKNKDKNYYYMGNGTYVYKSD